jgi:hypothetical protein
MWYSKQRLEDPGRQISELQDFTVAMLGGKPSSQALSIKAMEAKGLVPFVVDLLSRNRAVLPTAIGGSLIGAGEALVEYFSLMDECPRVVPPAALQRMYDCMKRHVSLSRMAKVPMKPKHHMCMHLVGNTARDGNPSYYATFTDEGINRALKKVGQSAHRNVWEVRVFLHFGKVEDSRVSRKRHLSLDV